MEFEMSNLFKNVLLDDKDKSKNIDKAISEKEKLEQAKKEAEKKNNDILQKINKVNEIKRIYKEETPPEYKEKKVAVVIPVKHYDQFNEGMKEKLNPYISKLDKQKNELRKKAVKSFKQAVNEVNEEQQKSSKSQDNSSIFDIFSGGSKRKNKIKQSKRKTKKSKKIAKKKIIINLKMRGVFTKKAKKHNMSVQKYANYVIKKYKGKKKTKKQLKLLRQAVFAKTSKSWKQSSNKKKRSSNKKKQSSNKKKQSSNKKKQSTKHRK